MPAKAVTNWVPSAASTMSAAYTYPSPPPATDPWAAVTIGASILTEDPECLVERSRHAREQVSEFLGRRLQEVADVAADGQRGTVAADEHGPHGSGRRDPAGDDAASPAPIRRSMALRASGRFEADGRDAVGDRVVDGLQSGLGTERFDPGGGVGELTQRGDAAVQIEPQHVGEFRVQRSSRPPGNAPVVARHQQAAVVEDAEVRQAAPPPRSACRSSTTGCAAWPRRRGAPRPCPTGVPRRHGRRSPSLSSALSTVAVTCRQRLVQRLGRRDGAAAGFDAHVRPRT